MKTLCVVILFLGTAIGASAGTSAPHSFRSSAVRQDFTGQGTYHRIGLVREQNRAVAAAQRAAASEGSARPPTRPGFLVRLWQSLFPPRSQKSQAPAS